MRSIPNDAQLALIQAALANPVPAGLGYYAPKELNDTPFATAGFLSAYALEFVDVPVPAKRKRSK